MRKKAGLASVISQIISQIQSPKPSVAAILSKDPGKYPSLRDIRGVNLSQFNIKPGPGPSNALGFVSTKDIDKDGYIDTINIVSPVIEERFRKAHNKDVSQFQLLEGEQLASFLNEISEILLHEGASKMGHLGGGPLKYDENVGFGSESRAESAVPKPNKALDSKTKEANLEEVRILKKLSSDLSRFGNKKLSTEVESLIRKLSNTKRIGKK